MDWKKRRYFKFSEITYVVSAECELSARNAFHKRFGFQPESSCITELSLSEVEREYSFVKKWTKEDHENRGLLIQQEWGRDLYNALFQRGLLEKFQVKPDDRPRYVNYKGIKWRDL